MSEENLTRIMEMISAAGMARTRFLEALKEAKSREFGKVEMLMRDGEEWFGKAHQIHSEFLASGCVDVAEGNSEQMNLILVHGEDQMMCAETFRLLVKEFIELYQRLEKGEMRKDEREDYGRVFQVDMDRRMGAGA